MTKDYILRIAIPEDAKSILEIYSPVVMNTPTSFEEVPPTVQEMTLRIENILASHSWIVAEDQNKKIMGYAYAGPHQERATYRWSVNVSAYIREGYRGFGLGKELYSRLFEILKSQNYCRAFAGITLPNDASVGLHEKIGFKHLGTFHKVGFKMGKWHNVGWWELSFQNEDSLPLEIRST